MGRNLGKKDSKRMSCHKRYKILRKVREHNRKVRRDARKTNKLQKRRNKKSKPINVPRNCPFKEDLLGEAALVKQGLAEERELVKEQRKLEREKQADTDVTEAGKKLKLDSDSNPVADVVNDFGDEGPTNENRSTARFSAIQRTQMLYVKSLVTESEIVLEVLDARDPLGSRNREIERRILESGGSKRIVLVLNKIDLVPAETVRKWLAYLRQEFPTIAINAKAQVQLAKLGRSNKFKDLHKKQSGLKNQEDSNSVNQKRAGSEWLMQLLKNYVRVKQAAGESTAVEQNDAVDSAEVAASAKVPKAVTVSIIGYPGVGKRSVSSCLQHQKTSSATTKPAHLSRVMRAIQLDRNLRLLDPPGVILDGAPLVDANTTLRNALEADYVHETMRVVNAIITKIGLPKLTEHFRISDSTPPKNASEFLNALARRHGMLKKGGVSDTQIAARRVAEEWQSGAISYSVTPATEREPQSNAELAASFAREFDVGSVYSASDRYLLTAS